MGRNPEVRILLVEADETAWPRAQAFFEHQLGLVGGRPAFQIRRRLPDRAAGFDLVSLDGRGLLPALLERPDFLTDLRRTPIVNLHAGPRPLYGHLRFLLGRGDEGAHPDGLWVFPLSWMAPWFQDPLGFPELGLGSDPQAPRAPSPDRTWERRSIRPLQIVMSPLAYATRG